MNIADNYAQTLLKAHQEKDSDSFATFFDSFIALLKDKSHYSLIPSILDKVQIYSEHADKQSTTTLVVADKSQEDAYKKELAGFKEFAGEVEVQEEPNLVGGYVARNTHAMLDMSYRSKLLSLYKEMAQ